MHWQQGSSRRVRRILASYLSPSSTYPLLIEKIGPPLIILVSDFQRLLGEHPQIHPRIFTVFRAIQKKPKILGLEFAIALDCIGLQVVVAGHFPFRFVSLVSGSSLFSLVFVNGSSVSLSETLVFVQFSVGNFVKPQLLHTNSVFHVRPLKIVVGKNRI